MSTHHLVTPDGSIVLPGAMLHAVKGTHAGTHWRLERVISHGVGHLLRCTRLVRKVGRVVEHFHPSVFGLDVIEVTQWFRITRHDLARFWRKIDDGLFMGLLALIPLAFFEGMNGSEHAHALLSALFGE